MMPLKQLKLESLRTARIDQLADSNEPAIKSIGTPYLPLCTPYAPLMCTLHASYVPLMHPLCAPYAPLHTPYVPLCTLTHPYTPLGGY